MDVTTNPDVCTVKSGDFCWMYLDCDLGSCKCPHLVAALPRKEVYRCCLTAFATFVEDLRFEIRPAVEAVMRFRLSAIQM